MGVALMPEIFDAPNVKEGSAGVRRLAHFAFTQDFVAGLGRELEEVPLRGRLTQRAPLQNVGQ
jgi:hypothetical protein